MQLIDFFIVGTQKGGTTALDSLLRAHPKIQMASVKETHFFDDEGMEWYRPNYAKLHRHFEWTVERVRGEATPIYCYWPQCLSRLCHYNQAAKLIMGLRQPTFRAYSHWRMETRRGQESLPFCQAISEGRKRICGAHRVFSYVERSFYASQITRMLSLFPRENILFFRTDALWADHQATLSRIHAFLGVADTPAPPRKYIAPFHRLDGSAISRLDRDYLDTLFASDISRVAELTSVNLDDWLDRQYCEPMMPEVI